MERMSIEGNPCLTCKWGTKVLDSYCNTCPNCSDCSNTTNGNCNCLAEPEEGETICPYYVEVKE